MKNDINFAIEQLVLKGNTSSTAISVSLAALRTLQWIFGEDIKEGTDVDYLAQEAIQNKFKEFYK